MIIIFHKQKKRSSPSINTYNFSFISQSPNPESECSDSGYDYLKKQQHTSSKIDMRISTPLSRFPSYIKNYSHAPPKKRTKCIEPKKLLDAFTDSSSQETTPIKELNDTTMSEISVDYIDSLKHKKDKTDLLTTTFCLPTEFVKQDGSFIYYSCPDQEDNIDDDPDYEPSKPTYKPAYINKAVEKIMQKQLSDLTKKSNYLNSLEYKALICQKKANEFSMARGDFSNRLGTVAVVLAYDLVKNENIYFFAVESPAVSTPKPLKAKKDSFTSCLKGKGHAETTILNNLPANYQIICGGVSRNICKSCFDSLKKHNLELCGPTFNNSSDDKTPYRQFKISKTT